MEMTIVDTIVDACCYCYELLA